MDKKKELLKEELKRHKQILEYNFYVTEEGDEPEGETENLLFDNLEEQEEEITDVEEPVTDEIPVEDIPVEEPSMEDPMAGEEEIPMEDPAMSEDPFGSEIPVENEFAEEPVMDDMGGEEQVEVDVTDIVTKTEEAKEETAQVSSKVDDLLGKFSELESRLGGMDEIISKMDELEKEVIQRNPTPVEKLNMRSMESFPYSVKLTDFWEDREGYDTGGEEVEKEYTLTQDEVDYDYNETDIRNTFKPKKD
jgi:hypothetical protein